VPILFALDRSEGVGKPLSARKTCVDLPVGHLQASGGLHRRDRLKHNFLGVHRDSSDPIAIWSVPRWKGCGKAFSGAV